MISGTSLRAASAARRAQPPTAHRGPRSKPPVRSSHHAHKPAVQKLAATTRYSNFANFAQDWTRFGAADQPGSVAPKSRTSDRGSLLLRLDVTMASSPETPELCNGIKKR